MEHLAQQSQSEERDEEIQSLASKSMQVIEQMRLQRIVRLN
jgi:hypothetical protein